MEGAAADLATGLDAVAVAADAEDAVAPSCSSLTITGGSELSLSPSFSFAINLMPSSPNSVGCSDLDSVVSYINFTVNDAYMQFLFLFLFLFVFSFVFLFRKSFWF